MSTVALVTGASSGLGHAIAQRLARDGFRTFGTSRTPQPDADDVTMVELDVRSDESVRECVQTVVQRAGRIDVLVNNAGILDVGPAEERTIEEMRAIFETNFFGVVRVTGAVLPSMRERRSGRIVNIGSLAGLVAPPCQAVYAASKHALEGYSEALRYEVAPFGIWLSIVEPGFVRTALAGSAPDIPPRIADYDAFRRTVVTVMQRSFEQGADPDDVAKVVARIVSSPRPRLRYRVGRDAAWVPRVKALVPDALFAAGLRRTFGIR